MTTHENYLTTIQGFHDAIDTEKAELVRKVRALTDDNINLTQALNTRDATVSELRAEVARLTALLSPWESIYSTDFAANDGWTLQDARQNHDASRNLPRNAVFGDGLRIVGKRERTGIGTSLREFTTADALGQHIEIPNYFRAKVVGHAPHAKGLWPCLLWFRPLNGADGEIDVMENFGGQAKVKATLHGPYKPEPRKMLGRQIAWPNTPAGVHEYVIEKTPDRIFITVDDLPLMDVGPSDAAANAFPWAAMFENPERTWYPRITLQIGCGTDNPNCSTGFPAADFTETDMRVESLEIWAWKGAA